VKVAATRRLPGPAWDELPAVVVGLPERDAEVEALIVANETVDEALLERFPALRLVANFGVGFDRVDVAACAHRHVAVTNTPGVLDDAVADLTLALVLAVRRRIVEGDRYVRAGRWGGSWAEGSLAQEVSGATLGIVGFGRIGRAVARRADAFGMRVLSVRSTSSDDELDELLRRSDIVTLHVPRTPRTERLLDARRLSLLADGACLVNTARGEIVDEPALVAELVSGRIRAGLDVFAHEPHVPEELLRLDNVVLTPHVASGTAETRAAMTRLVVDNVLALARGEPLLTPVSA
jgi:glyoxylate reductase